MVDTARSFGLSLSWTNLKILLSARRGPSSETESQLFGTKYEGTGEVIICPWSL